MSDKELSLFEDEKPLKIEKTAEQLRDKGIQRAVDNADFQIEGWSQKAFEFLLKYIRDNKEFLAEDIRIASKDIVPEPPNKRAWGGVIVRAANSGLIVKVGYKKVKNIKAHCTPATLWGVVIKRKEGE